MPNPAIDRSAQQLRCWVPVVLRAPAPDHCERYGFTKQLLRTASQISRAFVLRIPARVSVVAIPAALSICAYGADSTNALIVLTTVGYLTGAADGCKVAPKQSNQLSSGIAIAIGHGSYGEPAEAHVLFNNARQRGIADAEAGKVDCAKVGDAVQKYVRSLRRNSSRTANAPSTSLTSVPSARSPESKWEHRQP
jgi:hypothetical protein